MVQSETTENRITADSIDKSATVPCKNLVLNCIINRYHMINVKYRFEFICELQACYFNKIRAWDSAVSQQDIGWLSALSNQVHQQKLLSSCLFTAPQSTDSWGNTSLLFLELETKDVDFYCFDSLSIQPVQVIIILIIITKQRGRWWMPLQALEISEREKTKTKTVLIMLYKGTSKGLCTLIEIKEITSLSTSTMYQ